MRQRDRGAVRRRMHRRLWWVGLIAAGAMFQAAGCVSNPDLVGYQVAVLLRTALVQMLGFALINR